MEECLDAKSGAAAAAADGLPDDAIVEILSRVPARSISRFKCVSKPWRDLIADPLYRKRLPQTLEGFFCSDGAGAAGGFRWRFISLPGRSAPLAEPSSSFLTKLPGIRNIRLLGSCNGLLLFEDGGNPATAPAYVVCNPATEEWVAVPSAGCACPDPLEERTNLIFDPAVSPHFHLVHICQEDFMGEIEVRAYSSETRVWSDRASQQSPWQDEGGLEQWVNGGAILKSMFGGAFVNNMLHLVIFLLEEYRIAAVDRGGKTCRIIPWPDKCSFPLVVGQSQGRLHCVGRLEERERNYLKWAGLSIWVLDDYDTEEWVLKHRVSFLELFGQMSCHYGYNINVLAVHPDRNLIFIVQKSNQKLISYDMDSKELHAFHTLGHNYGSLTPYVPNFMELVVTNCNNPK
ncbi:hypothetical protein SEVIR_2G066000v4 [Setaria viridis]|uniref:F-box domain-containing protein n=1 Tax=Setaria viridis TaxID=4556 RepID=A0A4U6VPN4_SETVI|nr:F-box protein At2g23160-like [Setaria viridis]TKW30865.1 hypothetical protein SEVIR_2G066000v2 [Setaria viridis]